MRLIIDTVYLGRLCHPKADPQFMRWLQQKLRNPEFLPIVPDVVDYELRRGYLLQMKIGKDPEKVRAFRASLARLEEIGSRWRSASSTRPVLRKAAELWAQARETGRPGAHGERIDIDVIVAAHALEENAAVLTSNRKHFDHLNVRVISP